MQLRAYLDMDEVVSRRPSLVVNAQADARLVKVYPAARPADGKKHGANPCTRGRSGGPSSNEAGDQHWPPHPITNTEGVSMKTMKTPRGTARAQRRVAVSKGHKELMAAPSAAAQAAQLADLKRANRKRATAMYHKAGVGVTQ